MVNEREAQEVLDIWKRLEDLGREKVERSWYDILEEMIIKDDLLLEEN